MKYNIKINNIETEIELDNNEYATIDKLLTALAMERKAVTAITKIKEERKLKVGDVYTYDCNPLYPYSKLDSFNRTKTYVCIKIENDNISLFPYINDNISKDIIEYYKQHKCDLIMSCIKLKVSDCYNLTELLYKYERNIYENENIESEAEEDKKEQTINKKVRTFKFIRINNNLDGSPFVKSFTIDATDFEDAKIQAINNNKFNTNSKYTNAISNYKESDVLRIRNNKHVDSIINSYTNIFCPLIFVYEIID